MRTANIFPSNLVKEFNSMAFKKGISGNPGGRTGGLHEKYVTDQFRIIGKRMDPKSKKTGFAKLAEKIFNYALDGEAWAAQMVLDRVEGKVPQPVAHTQETKNDISQFSEAELTELLKQRLQNMPPVEQPKTNASGETLN
jgi:uncharacterized protein DUF5681